MMSLLLSLLEELVFASAKSSQRRFGREMNEYFKRAGLAAKTKERAVPAR